jgi:hypothetical protein
MGKAERAHQNAILEQMGTGDAFCLSVTRRMGKAERAHQNAILEQMGTGDALCPSYSSTVLT